MSKNFKYLDDLIHSGVKEIVLDSDIVLDDDEDRNYEYSHEDHFPGILVDVDNLIIDGNGYMIDAKEKSKTFKFTGKNIIIKNITIINSGALENWDGVVTITDSTFTHNLGYGGALFNHCGKLTIINCNFVDNEAKRRGGAIFNWGDMDIVNSIFKNNLAEMMGGAILNDGKLNITDSTFINNGALISGGAISNAGDLDIFNSTFSKNKACEFGGAIHSVGKFNVFNLKECTFKDNEPDDIDNGD